MSIVLTSAALGIAGATIGTGLGSVIGCFIGGLPMGNSPASACAGLCIGAGAGAAVLGTAGFAAPSIWAAVTAIAQSVFWSFSYLTAQTMAAVGVTTVAINPLVLTISAIALVSLGICACSSSLFA